ncbi:MAG: hypothetical protein K8T89_24825 [Planctomycetes bacterium]|nr:hypothetical protein [Planctomycetota bacterium]
MIEPLEIHDYLAAEPALEFIKRTRWGLRELRFVRVFKDKLHIVDVNGDYFEIRGVGYPNADVVALMTAVNTAFDPQTIQSETKLEYKEYKTGRRYPWASDRAM